MFIEVESKQKTPFELLEFGDTFIYNGGLYMVTYFSDDLGYDPDENNGNCVHLMTGRIETVDAEGCYEKIDTKVVNR